MAERQAFTTDDIEAVMSDPRWRGFGYPLGRSQAPRRAQDRADAALLAWANSRGWDAERLFAFADSQEGRWFADNWFGGWTEAEAAKMGEHILARFDARYGRGSHGERS
jgi:hypothetical protein